VSNTATQLRSFYAVALLVSWAYWIPDALAGGHWSHYPGLVGPAAAALIVSRGGIGSLWSNVVRVRVPLRWYAAACVPVAIGALALLTRAPFTPLPSARALTHMPGLDSFGLLGATLIALLINGFGEEVGWRGFAWARLRAQHSVRDAALLLTVPWMVWHIPLFFIDSGMRGFSPVMLPGFVVALASGGVVLGWLYERSNSVLVVALFHTFLNLATATKGAEPIAPVVSLTVIVWAVLILRDAQRTEQSSGVRLARERTRPRVPRAARGAATSPSR
jgi:membrane protease YdiL (CAAX protease family)